MSVATLYHSTCAICTKISNFFKNIIKGIQHARQLQADYYVASELERSGEYRGESFDYLLKMVQKREVLPARKNKV